MGNRKLTLDDITDLRAYERERADFRKSIIELKKRRRVSVGPFLTLLFENRETIRFQIQEMARAEKIISDEGIETELRIYNPLIPDPGTLSATLFLELTTDEQLREWLPKLVGVERSVVISSGSDLIRCIPEEGHEANLTRDEITASVHYIRFEFTADQVARFGESAVKIVVDHPEYPQSVTLGSETVAELALDLHTE